MKHYMRVFFISMLYLLCASCYDSPYPLGSPDTSRIDERLLKTWIEETQTPKDEPYRAVICKFNSREYFVSFSDDNASATLARAYTTVIDGVPILNMQGIESAEQKDRTYLFFKYAFTADGNLQTWMISDTSPLLENKKFSSQAEFAACIKKNIHNEKLYGYMKRFKPAERMRLRVSHEH